jgi:hypothetical protein
MRSGYVPALRDDRFVKTPCPDLVRRGVVLRIEDSARPGNRVMALEFVDLRFADGRIERWIGMGWANHVPAVDEPITALLRWAEDLADAFEGNLDGDLRRNFSDVPSDPFGGLPTEVVVEWNTTLPDEAFGE